MTHSFPYPILSKKQLIDTFNSLGGKHVPFLFVIDYKAESGFVVEQNELNPEFLQFAIGTEFSSFTHIAKQDIHWEFTPKSFESYEPKIDYVQREIHRGNSFLVNLTQSTSINTNLSLHELYEVGSAKYKLWVKDAFTVLSPETFVKIKGRTISSYPMKGTIDATISDAESTILNDVKEKAEHATIVDLIRNDLSMVSSNVEVKRYRYVERLSTNQHDLLQVSSEVTGELAPDFHTSLGDILFKLLPAGSICGAPKAKTLEIIEKAEGYERGFYTGIFGLFDGENLDSAVMIRFIEQAENGLVFKSGGGITSQSDAKKEYQELIQKIYVPIS